MSEWFRENRWFGTFLIVAGLCLAGGTWFLFSARGAAENATAQFTAAAEERNRLERLDPFPSEPNYRKMKVHLDNYAASLAKLEENLKTHAIPAGPLAPNEFQARLRQAMLATTEKARANRVKVPDNFALGFDEFTVGLPNTADAPVLGQELLQAELLANILIESRVDGIVTFKRVTSAPGSPALPAAPSGAASAKKAPTSVGANAVQYAAVDLSFTAAPSVMRRVLNQIASSAQQFYIVRTLHIRNEKDKGPAREQTGAAGASAGAAGGVANPSASPNVTTSKPANTALNFIVGNEHLETAARVEMVRFAY